MGLKSGGGFGGPCRGKAELSDQVKTHKEDYFTRTPSDAN